MKRKLLTVLLAVVMVFGVFGLTACGGSNADEDYNYYGVKYELEDVKIEAATFQGVYKMFTTPGAFLLYVDSESDGAAARFAAINDFANKYDVTIYHFNPELSGGYAASKGASSNILTSGIKGAGIKTVQDTLAAISGKKISELKDNALWGITGADSTVSNGAVKYNGKLAAQVAYAANADYAAAFACSQKVPSFGDKDADKQYLVETINTMNLFGDARLHMYNDDNGVDALKDEKTDLYVTVANFAMFEHLLLNNEGYFPVFFGGTWCPNTQAIAKATNDIAKDYGIQKIYFFDPRLEDGTKIDAVKDGAIVENSAYLASSLNTRNTDAAGQWAALKDAQKTSKIVDEAKKVLLALKSNIAAADGFKADKEAVYTAEELEEGAFEAIAEAVEDAMAVVPTAPANNTKTAFELVKAEYTAAQWEAKYGFVIDKDGDYVVATKAAEYIAEKVPASDYDTDFEGQKAYQAAVKAAGEEFAAKAEAALIAFAEEVLKAAGKDDTTTISNKWYIAKAKAEGTSVTDASLEAAAKATLEESVYNYSFLYATFLDNYIKDADGKAYASMWNVGVKLNIGGKDYTKMCVPNIMMFNGEGDGAAKLVALAEAEYYYANVSVEGDPQNIAWTNAVKAVFDANPYAEYAPVMVVEEAPAAESAPAAGGSSSAGAAEAC